ncbi:MAG: nucleotide exchange factor GrpE, partial [Geminicoccaceae bacterium]
SGQSGSRDEAMNQTKRPERTDTPEAAEVEETGTATEARPGDADETAEPSERTAELEAELAGTTDRLLRTLAEMENLRRRTAREIEDARKYAITGFARELLEVADNLSRALESIPPQARGDIGFVSDLAQGIEITEKALMACFERHRIAKIEPTPGEKFDHNLHQAMFEVESDEHAPGTIAQVLQSGYVIADRLLRPALVGVAKAPSSRDAPASGAQGGSAAGPDDGDQNQGPGRRADHSR